MATSISTIVPSIDDVIIVEGIEYTYKGLNEDNYHLFEDNSEYKDHFTCDSEYFYTNQWIFKP